MPNLVGTIKRALSSLVRRRGRGICFSLSLALLALPHPARTQSFARPKVSRIDSVTFYASSIEPARTFYASSLGPSFCCKSNKSDSSNPFVVSLRSGQTIQVTKSPEGVPTSLLANISFATNNIGQLADFLRSKNIEFKLYRDRKILTLVDPDGNRISFIGPREIQVQPMTEWDAAQLNRDMAQNRNTAAGFQHLRLIHAGFIVHDRPAMEHFYKDILGFRPYWHGGMKDDSVDNWVSFQVPDGSDWIEFMLGVPDNADKHLRGVMNHIALGVTDIQAAKAQLIKNGLTLTEEPKIGRDGKWQLNVYDPDDTRIEFMEFTPKGKTCCSEFTAPHPKP